MSYVLISEETLDPRHKAIRNRILELYAQYNPNLKCPWSGRTGTILKRILKNNPSWPLEAFIRCVENRFASDNVNVAADPVDWLDSHHARLVNYALAPLDTFGRPKPLPRMIKKEESGFDSAYEYFQMKDARKMN